MVDVHNVNAWGEPTVNEIQYNNMISLHQAFFGWVPAHHHGNWAEFGVMHMAGGRRNRNGWWRFDGNQGITIAGARVNSELERRYQEAKATYDVQVSKAAAVIFPSEIFERMVCQMNGFFTKLRGS
jgi:hypothetical protein